MKVVVGVTDDLAACHALRRAVFMEEQGVSETDEMDDLDTGAIHLLAHADGVPAGTARILLDPPLAKIGRVAVAQDRRGLGIGRRVMEAAVTVLAARGDIETIGLGAQIHALDFYAGCGFAAQGPVYLDAGIPHRWMTRRL